MAFSPLSRFALPIAALAMLVAPPALAQAQTVLPNDVVSFDVAAEDWVPTDTAWVTVVADSAASGDDVGAVRSNLLAGAATLAPKAHWVIVTFDRMQDSAGLDRWHAVREARLTAAELAGLADRAKTASKPGRQFRVGVIDFSPTLAETEAVKTRLRAEIYKRAEAELAALKAAVPNRSFRIGGIYFSEVPEPREPVPQPRMMAAVQATPKPAEADLTVEHKLTLHARITLAATPPAPTKAP